MEHDYGYQPDKTESRNKFLGKIIILLILAIFTGVMINTAAMFFNFDEEGEDLTIITAAKHPLKIIIDKPKIIDQVGIYKVLESNIPVKEEITPLKVQEPKRVKLEEVEELDKRVIDFKEIEQIGSQAIKISENIINDSGFKAQISAMSKKESAKKYWLEVKEDYPKLFKDLKYFIQKINLSNRNSLFRLQIIGFKNEAEVESFCLKFIHLTKQSHSNCIIISP